MRSTTEVFEDHLAKRLAGKTDEDIKTNYHKNVILLTGAGTYVGHSGVRQSAQELEHYISNAKFIYNHTLVRDNYAFLEWTAEGDDIRVLDGADSFVIESGKIIFQSIHYTVSGENTDGKL